MKNKFLLLILFFLSSNLFANRFYVDPVNGSESGDGTISSPWKTLENVIARNLIESRTYILPYDANNPQLKVKNQGAPVKAGDTIMLYSGLHGEIELVNYINEDYITIMNVEGNKPVFKRLHLQSGKRWIFKGIDISSEPYDTYINNKLVFLESHSWQGPVSDIRIENCEIYSTTTPWTDAESWVNKASDGIIIKGDSVDIINNLLLNIRFGITMTGDYILVSGNTIKNFSGDGIRINGSRSIVEKNIIKNCYAVDDNHDDGIQSFATSESRVDNNIVRQNIILNYEDPDQPLLGPLQGIGCFNGPYVDWVVENNLVIVDHWHGISFYAMITSNIINNTVLDPTPDTAPGPAWIKIGNTSIHSWGSTIRNNVANTITITSYTICGYNKTLQTLQDYADNFVDFSNFDFHLLETSKLIDIASDKDAPKVDLDDNPRPSGSKADIGCYEYQYPSKTNDINKDYGIKIFPNPFTKYINITGIKSKTDIEIYNIKGDLIRSYKNIDLPAKLNLSSLPDNIYLLLIKNNLTDQRQIIKVIKNDDMEQ